MAIFEKPSDDERQHLQALFVQGRVDVHPVSKILNDGGAAINIMSYMMYQKLGKGDQNLTKTDMMLKDFEGNVSPAKGDVYVELTIGSRTLRTTFFVINGKKNLMQSTIGARLDSCQLLCPFYDALVPCSMGTR